MAIPPFVRQVEQVTAEMLGGASEQELAAFRVAAFHAELELKVPERTAILLVYGDGAGWRERVAERVPIAWEVADGRLEMRPPNLRAVGKTHDPPGTEHTGPGA